MGDNVFVNGVKIQEMQLGRERPNPPFWHTRNRFPLKR